MFSEDDMSQAFSGGSVPPRPGTTSDPIPEPEPPGEPRIRATLHERTRWKQLFRDAVTLTLDTLDDAGDRMSRELGLHKPPVQPKPEDTI